VLISLDDVSMAFGHVPLLDRARLRIEAGERVAVIGRNGTGKSTLLRVLSGELVPDEGTIWRAPDLRAARLEQDATGGEVGRGGLIFDLVAEGLGELRDTITNYHHAAAAVAEHGTTAALEQLGRLQHELDERGGWSVEQRVELVLSRLNLPSDATFDTLSGGWRRRALLARALVSQPALLLLDEPTNHLDIEAIEWLETFLAEYEGAIVFVTHDRAFLQKLATRVVELDRGRLTSWPGDYRTFLEKKEAWLANESLANEKFDKRLAQEEAWLRRGVKARRTRDEGRVKALMAMREQRAARRAPVGQVAMTIDSADRSGKVVFDAEGVTKSYDAHFVVKNFSARVMRGDRIGLIGPNGAGKTTLLRMLVGELTPDAGRIERGTHVEVAYFDQQREQLDPERTIVDTIADGNDTVTVAGVNRHVYGYLEDFLFPPERARSTVKSLSGGERNRLLLARLLTRMANVLILDEPTNDLDIETLELLEAQLVEFPGTILVVSHDRTFLNNLVTSTWAFEGGGTVEEFVGGYDDWQRQRAISVAQSSVSEPAPKKPATAPVRPPGPIKLSYRQRLEFEQLPARIEALERERSELEARIASPDFYKTGATAIAEAMARLEALGGEIEAAYQRWSELDARASN
jgi:ATP-binding cassette subfamily F protein uup